MEMDKLAVFFAGSILVTLGMIVIAGGAIVINNLIHRYWKPMVWFKYQYKPVYFDPVTGEQLVKEPESTPEVVDGKSK
jgi:hypothetical protein